jgi:hypothetical protein
MSSKPTILTSGCGISFSRQQHKTWVNILQSVGANIIDVSGPAVSNQWIVDRACLELFNNSKITHVVIQLTYIYKLDVEIDTDEKFEELVKNDPLRNFVYQGVWPSSSSDYHYSKQVWKKWLCSPGLMTQELFVKLKLLENWCKTNNIKLYVYQGYNIPWTNEQKSQLGDFVLNLDTGLSEVYHNSLWYQYHVADNHNAVPCLEYQLEIAKNVAQDLGLNISDKIERLSKAYYDKKT